MVDMTQPDPTPRAGSAAAVRREPRALRSRALILDAVRTGLADTPLDQMTVSEVCRRAGVHRVTFYGHWPDVRAAAADAFAEVIDSIASIDEADVAGATAPADLAARYEAALEAQLVEIRDRRDIYRALTESPAFSDRLFAALEERARLAVNALVELGVAVPGARSGIAAAHLAGGVVAATARWARTDGEDLDAAVAEFVAQLPGWWPRQ
jgi:AcrR family transcriptional regulator